MAGSKRTRTHSRVVIILLCCFGTIVAQYSGNGSGRVKEATGNQLPGTGSYRTVSRDLQYFIFVIMVIGRRSVIAAPQASQAVFVLHASLQITKEWGTALKFPLEEYLLKGMTYRNFSN